MNKILLYPLISSYLLAIFSSNLAIAIESDLLNNQLNPKISVVYSSKHLNMDKQSYLDLYNQGNALLFYFNQNESQNQKSIMNHIAGISILGEAVLLQKSKKGPHITTFNRIPTNVEVNESILSTSAQNYLIRTNRTFQEKSEILSANPETEGTPGKSITVMLKKENQPCLIDSAYLWGIVGVVSYQKKDYCRGKMSASLIYHIDMNGSIGGITHQNSDGRVVTTQEGKFLTISISPLEGGGTGWHFADKMEYGSKLRFSGGSYYADYGPFAESFLFGINKLSKEGSNEPILITSLPANLNPEYTSIDIHRTEKGVKLSAKAAESPELGAEFNYVVEDTKRLDYKTYLYSVINNSYNNNASWVWDSKYRNIYGTFAKFTGQVGIGIPGASGDTLFFNEDKFNPVSYNSFIPTYLATYKAPLSQNGKSTFEIISQVHTAALLGYRHSYGLTYDFWSEYKEGLESITKQIEIDWSSPYFATEQNIRLQDIGNINTTKCLTSFDDNSVKLENCSLNSRAQTWGYDYVEKVFKSRLKNNFCLASSDARKIIMKTCSSDNNQKWVLTDLGIKSFINDSTIRLALDNTLQLASPTGAPVKFNAFPAHFE